MIAISSQFFLQKCKKCFDSLPVSQTHIRCIMKYVWCSCGEQLGQERASCLDPLAAYSVWIWLFVIGDLGWRGGCRGEGRTVGKNQLPKTCLKIQCVNEQQVACNIKSPVSSLHELLI